LPTILLLQVTSESISYATLLLRLPVGRHDTVCLSPLSQYDAIPSRSERKGMYSSLSQESMTVGTDFAYRTIERRLFVDNAKHKHTYL
jgi:hypothetical protein